MANLFRLSDQEVTVIKDALDLYSQWQSHLASKQKDEKKQKKLRNKACQASLLFNSIKS